MFGDMLMQRNKVKLSQHKKYVKSNFNFLHIITITVSTNFCMLKLRKINANYSS